MGSFTRFRLFKTNAYHITDPQLVREVLTNKQGAFSKNQHFVKRLHRLFGNGLFTAEGEHWKTLRKQTAPAFQPQSTNSYIPIINDEIERLCERWKALDEIDLNLEMSSITARVIARCVLGVNLTVNDGEMEGLLNKLMDSVTSKLRVSVNLPDWVPTAVNRAYCESISELDKFIYTHIRSKMGKDVVGVSVLWDLIQSAQQEGSADESVDEKLIPRSGGNLVFSGA